MSLVSKSIPGFYNGVSQQPASLRLDTQLDEQFNCFGTLIDGIYKRPNTEHVKVLSVSTDPLILPFYTNAFTHKINRDGTEQYVVVMVGSGDDPIEVFKLDGTKCTVLYTDEADKAYASAGIAMRDFKALTLADTTIILNKTKTVALASDTSSGTLTGEVQTFSQITTGVVGDIYKVYGDASNNFGGYYVKCAVAADTGVTPAKPAVYEETIKPGVVYKLDATTIPHKLVRTGTNEFTFSQITWADRLVGDVETNPQPSFVGTKLRNLFFFKNRLGFLSEMDVAMSRSGDYYNFWYQTALDELDDDPIDFSVYSKEVTSLQAVAVFEQNLILFSSFEQFSVNSDGPLTNKTISITPTTAFEYANYTEPVRMGPNVYFPSPRGTHLSVREYLIQADTLVTDAVDITAHVQKYLPYGFVWMVGCNNLDTLIVRPYVDRSCLYVYKYYWVGNEKMQSSWSKWDLQGDIIFSEVYESELYLIIKYGTQLCLEKIKLENIATGSLGFRVHLDRLVSVSGSYNAGTNTTTWTIPYTYTGTLKVVDSTTGLTKTLTKASDTSYTKVGNHSAAPMYFGIEYDSYFTLSEWFLKDSQGNSILNAKIQVRTLSLAFTDTGYFKVEVTPFRRETFTQEYTGLVVGVYTIGTVPLNSGEKRFIVLGDSKQLKVTIRNDTYLPSYFQSGSLEGLVVTRSRTI
jgi:hypothetical protein